MGNEKKRIIVVGNGGSSALEKALKQIENIKTLKPVVSQSLPAQPELLSDKEIHAAAGFGVSSEHHRLIAKAQLLKCHQSESAEIESLKADVEELCILSRDNSEGYEARIKELERINRVLEQQLTLENKPISEAIKEARADERKKIFDVLDPLTVGSSDSDQRELLLNAIAKLQKGDF